MDGTFGLHTISSFIVLIISSFTGSLLVIPIESKWILMPANAAILSIAEYPPLHH